jgi:hypothetical protein
MNWEGSGQEGTTWMMWEGEKHIGGFERFENMERGSMSH